MLLLMMMMTMAMRMTMAILKDLPHNVQSMVGVEGAMRAALIMGLL